MYLKNGAPKAACPLILQLKMPAGEVWGGGYAREYFMHAIEKFQIGVKGRRGTARPRLEEGVPSLSASGILKDLLFFYMAKHFK